MQGCIFLRGRVVLAQSYYYQDEGLVDSLVDEGAM